MKEILIEIIQLSGLIDLDFSAKAGIEQSRISEWKNGKKNIKFNTLQEIANKVGYNIELSIVKHETISRNESDVKELKAYVKPLNEVNPKCKCEIRNKIFFRDKACKKRKEDHKHLR